MCKLWKSNFIRIVISTLSPDAELHTQNFVAIFGLLDDLSSSAPVMVSASLQSGGAGRVSGWLYSPSLTYCSSWLCCRSGSGSDSGSWDKEGAGEASLAHLSLAERDGGHGAGAPLL